MVIPKTTKLARMQENFNVFDFTLNSTDLSAIKSLDTNKTLFIDHRDVERVKWLVDYSKDSRFKE